MVYNKHVLAAQLCTRTDVLSALTGMLDILDAKKKSKQCNPACIVDFKSTVLDQALMGSCREQTYELKWTRTRNRELAPSAWLQLTATFQKKLYRSSHVFHYFRVFIKISQWSVQDAGSGLKALLLPLPESWQSSSLLIQLLLLETFATHHQENTITSGGWSRTCLSSVYFSYWNSRTGHTS